MSEETRPQAKLLLVIYNNHVPDSGDPPSYVVNLDSNYHLSYFENCHGEQWVFVYDFDSEVGTVRGGDAGWEVVYPVVDGRAAGLILNRDEQM